MSEIRERPVLFSGEMVRAILDNRKSQTRRPIKPVPVWNPAREEWRWSGSDGGTAVWSGPGAPAACALHHGLLPRCPYGVPGDRLWVRENWDFLPSGDSTAMIVYWADAAAREFVVPAGFNPMIYGGERVRPSIHMPRWASRILLEVTEVRVQRIQDITEEDAIAEGVIAAPFCKAGRPTGMEHVEAFEDAWDRICGPGAWKRNDWVWCVSFRRIEVPRGR